VPKAYAKKTAAKKSVAKKVAKKATKKTAAKKVARRFSRPRIYRPQVSGEEIAGYISSSSGLLVPARMEKPAIVPPNKLREGIEAAQGQIKKTLQGFAGVFTQDFEVAEIELTLSFNAEGKFLGFGGGGAMSVAVKIVPAQEDGV
jgi:ribosomal protein L18E